jgi:nucleobase:cation symporter-1, NCS1 family
VTDRRASRRSRIPAFLKTNDNFSIEPVPIDERRGEVRNLATLWLVANVQLGSVTTGVIASLLGLSLFWAIFAIVTGNLVGAVFMAYHSAQGPKLGLPQMIQSRAQFGIFGALLPLLIALILYVGFYINGTVLIGQTLSSLLHISLTPAMWLGSVIAVGITYFGYDVIHKIDRYLTIVVVLVFVVITARLVTSPMHTGGSSDWGTVLLMISIAAGWQLTWAPYVSDYSRYLPESTSIAKTFFYTYAGAAGGGIWLMTVGALGGAVAGKEIVENTGGYVGSLFPGGSWVAYATIAFSLIVIQVMSLYSGFLSVVAGLFPSTKVPAATPTRLIVALVVGLGGTVPAVLVSGNFLHNFTNFILFVLYFIIPWTAINILDFYVVRRNGYVLRDLFTWRGRYGAVKWKAVITYVIALAAEIPFINSTYYEGPAAKSFSGADFAWIVGLLVSGTLYMVWVAPGVRRTEGRFEARTAGEPDAVSVASLAGGLGALSRPAEPGWSSVARQEEG